MYIARLIIQADFPKISIDARIYGGFAEHLGRHIYTGMIEPAHPLADAQGFRTDVMELFRGLYMPIVRYPGGNFVSGYDWEDGVGPLAERPKRLDLAWGVTETNLFGTNAFVDWCRKANTEPMLAVNLGTRGIDSARALVEYCNHPSGTALSDLRREHGYQTPHGIKTWCLGNEVDGHWQMGAKPAHDYGLLANEASKCMKGVDPSIETILCGSSGRAMPTFGTWEWESLHGCYENVDYVSLHTYYDDQGGDLASFFAAPDLMGDFIQETIAVCDAVKASKKSKHVMMLSFDEWNVWFPENNLIDRSPVWPELSTRKSDVYDMADALVVGGMLLTLLANAGRVRIACIAQIVNVLAPILTVPSGPAWCQTIYWPFQLTSLYGRGMLMDTNLDCPVFDAPNREHIGFMQSVTTFNAVTQTMNVFVINRDPSGQVGQITVDVRGMQLTGDVEHIMLRHDNLNAENTIDAPNNVCPQRKSFRMDVSQSMALTVSAYSWNLYRFSVT